MDIKETTDYTAYTEEKPLRLEDTNKVKSE